MLLWAVTILQSIQLKRDTCGNVKCMLNEGSWLGHMKVEIRVTDSHPTHQFAESWKQQIKCCKQLRRTVCKQKWTEQCTSVCVGGGSVCQNRTHHYQWIICGSQHQLPLVFWAPASWIPTQILTPMTYEPSASDTTQTRKCITDRWDLWKGKCN